jgi:hypothetical protein
MADRAVEEYASNSSTGDVSDSSSFVYGPGGSPTPGALTATQAKRVRFTTPIQPTDVLILEFMNSTVDTNLWLPANGNYWGTFHYQQQLSAAYGVYLRKFNATDVDVFFAASAQTGSGDYGAAGTSWSTITNTKWRVRKVSGGAQVGYPISPNNLVKSLVRYKTAAGQSISDSVTTIIDFGTKDFDTKNEVTTGASWKFTAAQTGYYRVNSAILFSSTTAWAESEYAEFNIYKNGVHYSMLGRPNGRDFSASTQHMEAGGSDIVYLLAGEYIDIRVYQNSGGTLALLNNSTYNHVSIEQIG